MSKYQGGLIGSGANTPSGTNYTGKAYGMWSLPHQIVTKKASLWALGISPPTSPIIGNASVGNSQITIAFTTPSSLNGENITNYAVTCSNGQVVTGASSPIIVTGLTNGTTYSFVVTANSTSGASISSATVWAQPANVPPSTIGQAWGGGFYAGKVNDVVPYYLIVAPKATGETAAYWSSSSTTTNITSTIAGPSNTIALASLGGAYQAAQFCKNLTIGGFQDWYLPAKNELEVLFYFLNPNSGLSNVAGNGANPYAVSPEPVNTAYTTTVPGQTTAAIFKVGGSDVFEGGSTPYWSSTETALTAASVQYFQGGSQTGLTKSTSYYVRAVRRVVV